MATSPMTKQNATNESFSPSQRKALAAFAAGKTVSRAAEAAGVDRSSVYRWLRGEPSFIAEVNRIREERVTSIQSKLREMSETAVEVLHKILLDEKAPASVRFKIALAVLDGVGGIHAESIGGTDVRDVRLEMEGRRQQDLDTLMGVVAERR